MSRLIQWLILGTGAVLVSAVVGVATYNIDDTVTDGNGYGFVIGDDQESVLMAVFEMEQEFDAIMYTYGAGAYTPVAIRGAPQRELMQSEFWYLIIGDSRSLLNNLRLHFQNQKLVEIRRSRRLVEFP